MTTTAPARPGLRDRLRRDWYRLRFELAMQDYPPKDYRRIARSLVAEIDAAAADTGMEQALRDLGSPRRLAAGYYAELDRERPRYWDGGIVLGLVLVGAWVCLLAYWGGAVDTLLAQGGGTVTLEYLGAPTTVTATDDELALGTSLTLQGALVVGGLAAVGFALGSRLWRLLPRRTASAA
ncbi:hypothetical protein AB6N24_00760 [Cellulomonas sp. 179-A 4D5 NHS]|uniref:hypothetical protein n=1 Tax=Cellulomonas sp. 179-A 4D5 NHS TaxID=3142378 RepID=UPI00399F2831